MALSPVFKRILSASLFYLTLIAAWVGIVWLYLNYIYWPGRETFAFTDFEFWGILSDLPGLDFSEKISGEAVRYEFAELRWLGILCALPLLVLVRRFSLTDLPLGQQIFNIGLRSLLILALVASLLQLHRVDFDTAKSATIFVVDVSESVPDSVLTEAREYIQGIQNEKDRRDSIKLITFSKRPRLISIPPSGKIPALLRHPEEVKVALEGEGKDENTAEFPPKEDSSLPEGTDKDTKNTKDAAEREKEAAAQQSKKKARADGVNQHTNIQSALRLSYNLFPPEHLRRLVLITDGNQTEGDLLGEAFNARTYGVKIYTRHFDAPPRPEVMIRTVTIPSRDALRVEKPFEVEVEVFSTLSEPIELTLESNLGKDYSAKRTTWKIEKGENVRTIELFPEKKGNLPFVVALTDIPGCKDAKVENGHFVSSGCQDYYEGNNRYEEMLQISDKPTILYVEGDESSERFLRRALAGDGKNGKFKVDARGPSGLPYSIDGLLPYDAVIFSNVPLFNTKRNSTNISSQQMSVLDRYVRKFGGGLIAIGGDQAFALGGLQGTAIERMLPIEFKSPREERKDSLALALVIDKSGSMGDYSKLELAKDAAKKTVDAMKRRDRIMVIGFDKTPRTYVRLQRATNRVKIKRNISAMKAGGDTDIEPALTEAFLSLLPVSAKIKHVILLSDGESRYGNIPRLARDMKASRITVSTVAVGSGADMVLLKRIAKEGGGRSYYTDDPSAIPRIFMQETNMVTKNAVSEEAFTPKVVKKHAMIRGISSFPVLFAHIKTKARKKAEVILRESGSGAPVLATWRRGSGRVTAFTSDAKNRWAANWLNKPKFYGKFWTQVVRNTMRNKEETLFEMKADVRRGRGHLTVDALGENDHFINELTSIAKITPPQDGECAKTSECVESFGEGWMCCGDYAANQKAAKESVRWDCSFGERQCFTETSLQQTAPGMYEIDFDLQDFGSYSVEAVHYSREGNKLEKIAQSRATLSHPFPAEYFYLEPNRGIVNKASEVTGGEDDPKVETLFDPGSEKIRLQKPLWHYFIAFAAFLLILDILFRRVRFWGGTEIPWSKVAGSVQKRD